MKYRIVKDEGYYIEECPAKTRDAVWVWTHVPGTWAFIYWGARFDLWRLIRQKARKPTVVYCVEVR